MKHLIGVSTSTKKDGTIYYRSSITHKKKHISLGSFPTMELAHMAYKNALLLLHSPQTLLDFNADIYQLSFDKWVTLVNYRENHIYFSTPIYIKNKYFEYHLAQNICLKFDLEDLFYYSSHKIMQRKGHLFVADYGMQVTIANRYGIKNYSILNKDYRFINNDCNDYRYENIEILNSYQGVCKSIHKGITVYKAKIHIHGNYIIGHYKTDIEAAIAYNKAIDILIKKGVTKNFTPNYILDYNNQEYAQIYTKLKISKKIKDYELKS